jgi:anti-anti-sigma factor
MLVCRDDARKASYFTPDGDLVAGEAEVMRVELQECMRQKMETFVIDLARVRTIDSLGLYIIIELYEWIRKSEGELIIENASRDLKKLFRLMRIDGRLTISRTGWPS